MKFTPPLSRPLRDPDAEAARSNADQRIRELQDKPGVQSRIINDVVLPNAAVVLVSHGLGRRPRIVLLSPPRGASSIGIIEEKVLSTENPDRTKFVALKASGMTTTVTVDVEVK